MARRDLYMASVFQKFGGIRPMAAKVGDPVSTVKSWHKKRRIPKWRHDAILASAERENIELVRDELEKVREDDAEFEPQAVAA